MRSLYIWLMVVILAVAVLALSCFYTTFQTHQALILRLGNIEKNAQGQPLIVDPGLHVKMPFIDTVRDFDMRLRTLNIDSSRIVTAEQKDVMVDAFVMWRINNVVAYYKSTGGDERHTATLLSQKTSDALRAQFGKLTIQELVSAQRSTTMDTITQSANEAAAPLGVQILDVRIKRIDLPTEVAQSVFARMSSEREKEAALIRAQGQQQAEQIRSDADAKVTITIATAGNDSAQIRAQGEAGAAKIYNDAYQQDPTFYQFYRSLEVYRTAFSAKQDIFVLTPKSDLFKYFTQTHLLSTGSL